MVRDYTSYRIVLFALFAYVLAQDPPFTVTRPDPGDTLVLSSDQGANELYVDWTVAPGTEDLPVLITLQRGEDLASLETIEVVNGSALNNGSYTWSGVDSISLASGEDDWLARTACNYTIRLSVDGLVAYSQYFTIVNGADGPVPDSATCPIEQGTSRPQFADGATSTVLGSEDAVAGDSTGNNGGGGGISTSTLAVAIVIPIVVLLIIFGLLLWFGIRRGWFVKLANKRSKNSHLTHDNTVGLGDPRFQVPGQQDQYTSPVAEKKDDYSAVPSHAAPPQELHADYRPWEAEGAQVHQLEGDERDARFTGGQMRSVRH